ncbi:MAG: GntR family transcriptional regulator, partial [bacterium]
AYLLLKDQIVTVELSPGAVIDEKNLTERLGLGRTPIREALGILTNERLVTAIPRRGRVVSEINLTDLRRIYEARSSCELPAVQMAAQRASPADKAVASRYIADLEKLGSGAFDERDLVRLDYRCHAFIYRCTKNPFFEESLVRYLNLAMRLWYYQMDTLAYRKSTETNHAGIDELVKLLGAIIAGNPPTAIRTAREHILRSQNEILQSFFGDATGSQYAFNAEPA